MLKSKFFMVMNVLTLLAAAAAIVFLYLEMQEYGMIDQLMGK